MTDLSALAEKVEGLSGPCRETDVLIVQALYPDIGPCEPHCAGDTPIFWNDPLYKKPCPTLTASLDAVVALIEKELPGSCYQVGFVDPKHLASEEPYGAWARVMSATDDGHDDGLCVESAATPALALLAALLRAKGASNGNA